MSGDFTLVNKAAMASGIDALANAARSMEQELDQLRAQVSNHLAEWDGPARRAYTEAERQWQESANHMTEVTAKMQQVLGQIDQGYTENERALQAKWGG